MHAKTNLGRLYEKAQDYTQAHMWFNLAAAQGSTRAAKSRDMIAKKMTPAQVAEAQRLAREWLAQHQK